MSCPNLIPRVFPSKIGWGPTHFLREKPWGRGWSCPSRLGGFFEVIRWQTDFVAGSTPSKFLCNGYNFITIPVTCTEAHVQSPLHRHYLTHANNHITPAMAATLSWSSLACDGRNVSKIRIIIFILQFHVVSFTFNNANILSNVLNPNRNKPYLHEDQLQGFRSLSGSNKVGDNRIL